MPPQKHSFYAHNHVEKVLTQSDVMNQLIGEAIYGQAPAVGIAHYLRRMLEQYEESEFIKYLIAPSPNKLMRVFGCEENDVREALGELEREGYSIELAGKDDPVVLSDPLIREQTVRRSAPETWPLSYQNMVYHP